MRPLDGSFKVSRIDTYSEFVGLDHCIPRLSQHRYRNQKEGGRSKGGKYAGLPSWRNR